MFNNKCYLLDIGIENVIKLQPIKALPNTRLYSVNFSSKNTVSRKTEINNSEY